MGWWQGTKTTFMTSQPGSTAERDRWIRIDRLCTETWTNAATNSCHPHMFMISCPPTHAILCMIFPFTSPYKSFVSLYISLIFINIYMYIYIYTSFDSILDTTTSTISFHLSSKSYSSHFMCRCPTPKKWEDRKIMWIHWDMMDNRVRHLGWSTLVVTLGDQSTRYTLWSINLLTLKLSNL